MQHPYRFLRGFVARAGRKLVADLLENAYMILGIF
jgi:hypothetical protein